MFFVAAESCTILICFRNGKEGEEDEEVKEGEKRREKMTNKKV